ncbi:MAG TPA: LppX_LprAFG lipoprotein [Actinomycetota bacterium]|nr:LppX_LprAFG lipoprotein [Actinomycetota bacterium]
MTVRRGRGAAIWLKGTAAAATLLLAACGGSTSPSAHSSAPDPATVLRQASQAMAAVSSAHFSIQITGHSVGSLNIKAADGVLARGGGAMATVKVSLLGNLVSEQVVELGGKVYLKGPTGGYQSEDAANLYDVSQLLDPTNGLAGTLGQATDGTAVSSESVSSTPAYKLTARVPTTILKGLADLAPGQDTVVGTLWVAQSGSRLLKAIIPFKVQGATTNTVVTAELSDFDLPVSITTPSTSS